MGKRVVLKPGAVVAIPRGAGGFYFVVFLTKNRFGHAFGLLQGHGDSPLPASGWKAVPLQKYAYSGNHLLKTGRWQVVGRDESLLKRFPPKPEIFHRKSRYPNNPSIGPFGGAETSDEEVRPLSESEAAEIGLIRGVYRQIMMEEQFEKYLQSLLG